MSRCLVFSALCIQIQILVLLSSGVHAVVIDFGHLPGPDGVPGTVDDVPYTYADITAYGGGRLIDDEYASAGVHFSGVNVPSLGIIGGGFDSDDVFGAGTNTVLNGVRVGGDPVARIGGIDAFSVHFDLPQTRISVDLFAYLISSGTSVPLTFRSGGVIVATETLTAPLQVSGRFILEPGAAFDQIDFGLSDPSNGGVGIDNLTYRGSPVYLRSTVAAPWNQATNEAALDSVFGAGNWIDERYETVDTAVLFTAPRFIFMEGSDINADELEAFLNAHVAQIKTFIAFGGVVFFNAAPNEGDGMGYPAGAGGQSVLLTFPDFSSNPVSTALPAHPIFNGPQLPTTTSFTGDSFAHASVSGAGLVSLLDDVDGRSALSEVAIGFGRALYGAMTTTNFHLPQPEADNLRANILAYGQSQVFVPEPSTGLGLLVGGISLVLCAKQRRGRSRAR